MEKDLFSHVQWKAHNGCRYLFINFQYCSDEERIGISHIVIDIIKKEALKSVLLLADVNNTIVTIESMRTVRKDWQMVSPNFNKVAIIGVTGFKSMLFKLWGNMMPYKTQSFATTQGAIKYLCP